MLQTPSKQDGIDNFVARYAFVANIKGGSFEIQRESELIHRIPNSFVL
jgi:hypothetical protein